MTDERKDQTSTPQGQADQQAQQPIKDLEVRKDEMDKVKGGLRRTADPCEGGE